MRVNIDFQIALEFSNLVKFNRNRAMVSLSRHLDCPNVHWLYINLGGLLRGYQLNFFPSRDDRIELYLCQLDFFINLAQTFGQVHLVANVRVLLLMKDDLFDVFKNLGFGFQILVHPLDALRLSLD